MFGRDEDDSLMELRQADVDGIVAMFNLIVGGHMNHHCHAIWSEILLAVRWVLPLSRANGSDSLSRHGACVSVQRL